jgi:hypothetical protein
MLADARAEADQLRSTARTLLADARSEVDALARRRTAITAELGQLSGVIEALAVPENGTGAIPRPVPSAPSADGPTSDAPADAAAPATPHDEPASDDTVVLTVTHQQPAHTDAGPE